MGIRQCGKTYISQLFAEENYKHVVYINFIKQKRRKEAFYDSKDVPREIWRKAFHQVW
ncbi:AAA family ATPase [Prevotella sp. P5-92]|uniref:AAA family ATPase n=1 Tax=Prevotella sp. P5-92 TaxID=2024222 RepID=UPI00352FC01C